MYFEYPELKNNCLNETEWLEQTNKLFDGKFKKSPGLFEPRIIDIHNESVNRPNKIGLNQLILQENSNDRYDLSLQNSKLNRLAFLENIEKQKHDADREEMVRKNNLLLNIDKIEDEQDKYLFVIDKLNYNFNKKFIDNLKAYPDGLLKEELITDSKLPQQIKTRMFGDLDEVEMKILNKSKEMKVEMLKPAHRNTL